MSTRRHFLAAAGALGALGVNSATRTEAAAPLKPLEEFGYGDVTLAPGPAQSQFEATRKVLLGLNDDALLRPWRLRAGLDAPGPELGGWYDEVPLNKTESGGHGFAPAHSFGQWMSALARGYAVDRDPATRAKLQGLVELYSQAVSPRFYQNFRFPAYNYDKLVIGLLDAQRWAGLDPNHALLQRTTDAAEPHLPPTALDRDEPQRRWRESVGEITANDYTWDESYTLAENLYLAYASGAGDRYRLLARRFLLDRTYFDPLSEGRNVLANHHAYSFTNALSSAMQAYLTDGSQKHLKAASNAFDMLVATQSFASGGWGPDESFRDPATNELAESLTKTHKGFETPCGSYAHAKLTRYLLRVTRDGRYGDSLEQVLYNTVLGAMPLEGDGHAFYYADYHQPARKSYFPDRWPCCSGTLPQIAADYRRMIYLRDADGLWINLYLPSTLRWTTSDGTQATLEQSGNYPNEGSILFRLRLSRPSRFGLRLRIPEFAAGQGRLSVNNAPVPVRARSGFASIERGWRDGDSVQLTLPLPLRVQAIDSRHPQTVALLRGPLALFALADRVPAVTKQQLLAATALPGSKSTWQVKTSDGLLGFQPFESIQDQSYCLYVTAV